MTIYHGSYIGVEKPDVSLSRENVDFGKEFYTAPLHEQAVKWAGRFKIKKGSSIVTGYGVAEEDSNCRYLIFKIKNSKFTKKY